jgi:hypothetical protein
LSIGIASHLSSDLLLSGLWISDSATKVWVSTHVSVATFPFVHEGVCDEFSSVRGLEIGMKVRELKSAGQGAEG